MPSEKRKTLKCWQPTTSIRYWQYVRWERDEVWPGHPTSAHIGVLSRSSRGGDTKCCGGRRCDGLPDRHEPDGTRGLGGMSAAANRSRVLEWVDGHAEDIANFLQEMLRIPSVNPWFLKGQRSPGEEEVQAIIARRLKALGAVVEQWEPNTAALAKYEGRPGYYPGRDFKGRPNLAATLSGASNGRSLLLFGHIDVVKAGTGWSVDAFR